MSFETHGRADLAAAAQEYARQGFHIFPVRPGGKDPLVSSGFKAATTDPETVARWWTEWPTANIGVWPGGSGRLVLDVDVKADAGGAVSLDALALMYGDLPEGAPIIETPSGGWHVWLTLPWDAELPGNKPAAQGVDVRSANGYTILPPSRTDAGVYAARQGTPALVRPGSAPMIPEAWRTGALASAGGRAADNRTNAQGATDLDAPEDIERAEAYAATAPPAIEGEQGSTQTYKVACSIRDMGVSQDEAFRILDEIYNPRCEPPWDSTPDGMGPEYLASRVASAYRNARAAAPGKSSARHALDGFAQYAQPADTTSTGKTKPLIQSDETGDDIGEWTRKTKPARFLTDAQVDDMAPPEWDIENILPRQSLIALYGEPGSHKSFLALDWANHLARGMDWGGYEVDDARRVLYVGAEGSQGLQKRLRAWRQHHGAEMTDNLTLSPDMPRIADEDAWAEWVQDVKALAEKTPFHVVVFDTLAHLTVGLDENSNGDMMQAVSRLTRLRDELRASVMFVHHTAKGSKELRGAGAVRGACDAAFSMSKDGVAQSALKMTKQKDAEEWPGGISLTGHVITVGTDRKGRELTSLALTVGGAENPPTRKDKAETDQQVRERETREAFDQYATNDDTPAPSPEAERPLADRTRDALARIAGHEAKVRDLAREIVRDEIGAEPPSHLVDCRRDDLRKYASQSGTSSTPELVALVVERDGKKRAARFRLPPGQKGS